MDKDGSYSHPYGNIPLLIFTGIGRSGTTIVRNALSQHPDIECNGVENNVFKDVLKAAHFNCSYPSRKRSMVCDQKRYDAAFRNLILDILFPAPKDRTPKVIMISSAMQSELIDYLIQVFNVKAIVCVVRNGVEVVSSRLKYDGFRKHRFERHLQVWNEGVDFIKQCRSHEGLNFHCIRHENLLEEQPTAKEFETVFKLLDVPQCDDCSKVLKSNNFHPTQFENEKDPSLSNRKNRWKYWNETQLELFSLQCRESMEYLGYAMPWEIGAI